MGMTVKWEENGGFYFHIKIIMSKRADFLVQILERLGAPLMAAVNAVSVKESGGADVSRDAERIAQLLTRSVQFSVIMSESSGLRNGGDSVRLALAALGAELMGAQYSQTGKIPAEADIRKTTEALGAVLAFADNFALAADNHARLENLRPGDVLADDAQINIQHIALFAPVVAAIMAFPFGQPEKKLVQDIAARLTQTAAAMQSRIGSGADDRTNKRGELEILRGLARLYASCHETETKRIMAMNPGARSGAQSLDPVWKSFEEGAAMLEIIAGNADGAAGVISSSSAGELTPAAPARVPAAEPPAVRPAAPPPLAASPQPVAESPKVAPEKEAGYNPMSFFKPPKKDDETKG